MADKAALVAKVKDVLIERRQKEVVWGDIISAVATAPADVKAQIITAVKGRDYVTAARAFYRLLIDKIQRDAADEADALLLDDSVTLDELERILEG